MGQSELDQLYAAVMPALSKAAIGDFGHILEPNQEYSEQTNELIMGVEMLLESLREKEAEVKALRAERQRSVGLPVKLLDEVLAPKKR
jgi:hypothetical protein